MDLAILVPSSLTEESPDPRVRTYKVGTVGRAAAVFGAREIVIFRDRVSQRDDTRALGTVLAYQATAPYLRKSIYPRVPELQYAGVLPPLNLPTHTVGHVARVGEVREALQTPQGLYIGLPRPAILEETGLQPTPGERLHVEVTSVEGASVHVRRVPDAATPGYRVGRADGLAEALADFSTRIGTSRLGDPLHQHADAVRAALATEPSGERPAVAVAFGAPGRGLDEILESEGSSSDDALDLMLNTVVNQRTASVRTEEAVWVTLGVLNAMAGGL